MNQLMNAPSVPLMTSIPAVEKPVASRIFLRDRLIYADRRDVFDRGFLFLPQVFPASFLGSKADV